MRILHLDPDDIDNPLSGGGPVRTREIYKRLARKHEITVLTPTFPGSTPELVQDGIRYIRLGRKLGNYGSSHHLTYLASLPRSVNRYDHDLLVEDTMPPSAATWTPLFHSKDKPLVASVQWWFAHQYTDKLKLPFHWGQKYGIRLYRHIIVLTSQMAREINSTHRSGDCRVIPNGVDDGLFDVEPHAGKFMLYIGRIDIEAKGLDYLLQAMAMIPESDRIELVVAGQGQDDNNFGDLIDQLGLGKWVRRVGKVNSAERAMLLRDCRFTVMPSRFETFGMTIAEANAAGKVSIIFDDWPMNEVAAKVCPRVPVGDVPALAASIVKLHNTSDETILNMGLECRKWATRFKWDSVARDQETYYEEIVHLHKCRTHAKVAG